MLTVKQAWLKLADAWDDAKSRNNYKHNDEPMFTAVIDTMTPSTCLCQTIDDLEGLEQVHPSTAFTMRDMMETERQKTQDTATYMYQLTEAGAKQRAKFCRRMAKSC